MSRRRLRHALPLAAILMAWSAPSSAESLREVLAETYRGNPTLDAARAELRAVDENVPQASSNWRPSVSVNGSVGRQRREETTAFRTTEEITNPRTAQLQVNQPIFNGGSNFAELDQAKKQVRAQRARLAAVEQQVLLRGVRAYVSVWRDQRIVDLNRQNVDALGEQLQATVTRFEEGFVTRTDVSQARTRVSQARARLEDARTRLQNSGAQFEEVVGRRPGDLEPIDAVSRLPGQQGAASDRAASANPELAASKLAAEAASDEIRRREGQLLPSLSLRGTLSHREKTSSEESEVQDARVTLELQIPLYQAGEATSRVRQAKQRASQRRIEVSETERRVRQEAISAWNDYTGAQARIDQLEAAVESARASLEGVREEARAGARLVLDILDAQQELVNAQVNLVRARADRQIAAFALRRAVGNLSARALDLPVDYYQPERNYEAVDGLWWGLDAGDGWSGSDRGAE